MKKVIVISIIALFIVVSVQPAFANDLTTTYDSPIKVSDNNQINTLVEIPIQIHKSGTIETHTLTITEEQKVEFDAFINAFKEELDKAETFEETIAIYNNAIVTLDEFGLIPKDTSVEELQQLITGDVQLEFFRYIMQIFKFKGNLDTYENFFCLVSGVSSWTEWFFGWSRIWFGSIIYGFEYRDGPEPAQGWIHTRSFLKSFTYVGTFVGKIKKDHYYSDQVFAFIGVILFRGIYIPRINFYIGRAFRVWITPDIW